MVAIFISVIFIVNLAFYIYANTQYNREIDRQSESLKVMISHLASQEDSEVLLAYLEHYSHTNNVIMVYKNEVDLILFNNDNAETLTEFQETYYGDDLVGYLAYSFEYSTLGQEMTLGFILLNVSSIILFFIGVYVLQRYLNKQNETLESDISYIGTKNHPFQIFELEKLNHTQLRMMDSEVHLRKVYENHIRTLAHDIKTPLTVSLVYLEAVENHRIEFSSEVNQEITSELRRIESMIPKFIETDMNQLAYMHDISEQIKNQKTRYNDIFQTKEIEIQFDLQPLEVNISELDLNRIVENLAFNSFYYSNKGSTVKVSTLTEQRVLIVEDTGIGMTQDTIDKIQVGKYRDQTSSSYNSNGSGIGYQIIRDILVRIGGKMLITSQVGIGSKVEIKF